jgi:excisionase family DNA binding protein
MKAPREGLKTISIEEAGAQLGISRNSAYEAARRGDIPAIRIGKRLLVPIAAFEAMLAPKEAR